MTATFNLMDMDIELEIAGNGNYNFLQKIGWNVLIIVKLKKVGKLCTYDGD